MKNNEYMNIINHMIKTYLDNNKLKGASDKHIKTLKNYVERLSPVDKVAERYAEREKEAQDKSFELMAECEAAKNRNVFQLEDTEVKDSAGNTVTEIKMLFVIRDKREKNDKRDLIYQISTTFADGVPEIKTRAVERKIIPSSAIKMIQPPKASSTPKEQTVQTSTMHASSQRTSPEVKIIHTQNVRGATEKKKDDRSRENKPRIITVKRVQNPVKQQTYKRSRSTSSTSRKTKEAAKKKIRKCSQEDDLSSASRSSEDEHQSRANPDSSKKLPFDRELKVSLPRSMGPYTKVPVSQASRDSSAETLIMSQEPVRAETDNREQRVQQGKLERAGQQPDKAQPSLTESLVDQSVPPDYERIADEEVARLLTGGITPIRETASPGSIIFSTEVQREQSESRPGDDSQQTEAEKVQCSQRYTDL
ncbi:uncharacterized protein LOC143901458 [Temnothorax americanus]|uniref:uncharacterized protein LOC143901458 n=1 Tax=Temnothorax americanus TaxID=1964332 RepID=UPI004068157F